jgi:hypothetical protein
MCAAIGPRQIGTEDAGHGTTSKNLLHRRGIPGGKGAVAFAQAKRAGVFIGVEAQSYSFVDIAISSLLVLVKQSKCC